MATQLITVFTFGAPGSRTVPEWRRDTSLTAPTWQGKARQYASAHGRASVLLADGTVRAWYVDDSATPARIRTRHYQRVTLLHAHTKE